MFGVVTVPTARRIRDGEGGTMQPDMTRRGRTFVPRVLALAAILALGTAVALGQDDGPAADDVLVRLGETTIERSTFEAQFEVAARATALREGLEPTDEVLAQYDEARPVFLDQLARQLVLDAYAEEIGVAVGDEEIDDVVAQVRAQRGTDESDFEAYLVEAGFEDEADLRATVETSLNVQQAVEALAADVEVSDADVETWYEANQDLVQTEEGALPLEAVRDQVVEIVRQERVEAMVQEVVQDSDVEVFHDRL
jgi:hypothetical protein